LKRAINDVSVAAPGKTVPTITIAINNAAEAIIPGTNLLEPGKKPINPAKNRGAKVDLAPQIIPELTAVNTSHGAKLKSAPRTETKAISSTTNPVALTTVHGAKIKIAP
jgi:hypothetical protein